MSNWQNMGEIMKNRWPDKNIAEMDMPTGMGVMFGITSFNRWLFKLDHTEDGLIDPNLIWEYAEKRTLELIKELAKDDQYINSLEKTLNDRIGHPVWTDDIFHQPNYGMFTFYYLTNAALNPFAEEVRYTALNEKVSNYIQDIFSKAALRLGCDLSKANFGFGMGSPSIFLHQNKNLAEDVIENIERRPDVISLQLFDGRIHVRCVNKRLITPYDNEHRRIVLLDEILEHRAYFTQDEIEEFELLLNKSGLLENELQSFFEAHPKFIFHSDYNEIQPQITLEDEDGKLLRPDFFMRPIGRRLWEILDLKLPYVPLLANSRDREGLSFHVHRGVNQLMNYSRFFDNPRNREKVFKETGIDCFKPALTLVIGNKSNVDEALWNRVIDQERPFVKIMGYDEMLERAKRYSLRLER